MTPPSVPAGQKWPAEVLTPDEVQALINACSAKAPTGVRNRALFALLHRSGLRVSEAIGYPGRPEQVVSLPGGQKVQKARDPIPPLKVSNIDLNSRTVRLLQTKSSEAQTARLHPAAVDAVARWHDVRCQLGFNGRQPAFCTKGVPLSEQYVRACLGRLARKADMTKRVHQHAFRNTLRCRTRAGRYADLGYMHAAPALQHRRHAPVPGPPDQRSGGCRARQHRPAADRVLTP